VSKRWGPDHVFPQKSDVEFSFDDQTTHSAIGYTACGSSESGRFNGAIQENMESSVTKSLGGIDLPNMAAFGQVKNSTLNQNKEGPGFVYSLNSPSIAKIYKDGVNLVDEGFIFGSHYAAGHRLWNNNATSTLDNFGSDTCP